MASQEELDEYWAEFWAKVNVRIPPPSKLNPRVLAELKKARANLEKALRVNADADASTRALAESVLDVMRLKKSLGM